MLEGPTVPRGMPSLNPLELTRLLRQPLRLRAFEQDAACRRGGSLSEVSGWNHRERERGIWTAELGVAQAKGEPVVALERAKAAAASDPLDFRAYAAALVRVEVNGSGWSATLTVQDAPSRGGLFLAAADPNGTKAAVTASTQFVVAGLQSWVRLQLSSVVAGSGDGYTVTVTPCPLPPYYPFALSANGYPQVSLGDLIAGELRSEGLLAITGSRARELALYNGLAGGTPIQNAATTGDGTAADLIGWMHRSLLVLGSAGITAGALTFEGSWDSTTWFGVPYINGLDAITAGNAPNWIEQGTAFTVGASTTTPIYLTWGREGGYYRYARARISTAFAGGTVTVHLTAVGG